MSRVEERLEELGYRLEGESVPKGVYVPAQRAGDLIFVSGQVPSDGAKILYQGKAGKEYTVEEAAKAAELAAVQVIQVLREAADLDRIKIVKVVGFVNSEPDFTAQPQVVNGASELFVKVFKENGPHARSAVGVAVLPGNTVVEVEAIAQILK